MSFYSPFTKLIHKEESGAERDHRQLLPVGAEARGRVSIGVMFADEADPERKHGRHEETLTKVVKD